MDVRRNILWMTWFIVIAVLVIAAVDQCHGADWQISSFTGYGLPDNGANYWQESLRLKGIEYVYKRSYVGVEVDVTKYSIGWRGGAVGLFGYDFYNGSSLTFYSEAGGGIAIKSNYRDWQKLENNIVGTGLMGVIKAEIGVYFPLTQKFKGVIGIGYDHLSSFRSGDHGLNAVGFVLGVRW